MKNILQSMVVFIITFCVIGLSSAGELDILVQKLVEKNILSAEEAKVILAETKKEVEKEKEREQAKAASGPIWMQKVKLKGDARLRYQYEKKSNDAHSRNRGRIRYRLGIEAKVIEEIIVAAGLASGGSDPRSTNQTFQDTFSSKGINLDYAYAEYKPSKDVSVIAGKFKRKPYLWVPTDLLWDGDIHPEGGSFHYEYALADNTTAWMNGGIWILDENGRNERSDPFLKYIQSGVSYKEEGMDGIFAVTYYHPNGISGIALDNNGGTNTGASTALRSSYRSIALGTEVGFKKPFGGLPFDMDQRVAVFGEYVQNLDDSNIDDNLSGHSFGFKFGHQKVKKPGTWQVKYIKAKLGKDAWLDTFPDSDRFGGDTGIESHEVILSYAWKRNVILGLDVYRSWSQADDENKETLVQADMLFKF